SIEIRFEGPTEVNPSYVLKNLSIEKGMNYAPNLIDKSIENLMSIGQFENIRVFRDQDHPDPNSVALIFIVTPKLRITSIDFIGNDKMSRRKLRKKIESVEGLPLSEQTVKSDEQALRDYYLKKGYWSIQIGSDILRDDTTGGANIAFRIDEGDKRHLTEIEFVGNKTIKGRSLRKIMKTKKWRFYSFFTGSGRYKPSELEEDLTRLRRHYHNEGLLDVQMDQGGVQLIPDGRSGLRILIKLTEGKRYKVGRVAVKGSVLFDEEVLLSTLRLKEGAV
ncbi:uncharacterized protein METZ01_LOCUS412099, partial [marine metagenome]